MPAVGAEAGDDIEAFRTSGDFASQRISHASVDEIELTTKLAGAIVQSRDFPMMIWVSEYSDPKSGLCPCRWLKPAMPHNKRLKSQ